MMMIATSVDYGTAADAAAAADSRATGSNNNSNRRRRSSLLLEEGGRRTAAAVEQQQQQQLKQQPQPVYDVFLGGSCGNTCWRSDLVIPYLKKRAISYYDPQRPVWSENMILEEQRAKENSRIFLFVLDPGTINATSFLEIAYFAARKASKLVVVFLGRHEWSDKALKVDLPDRIRTCNLLEAILKRHSVLMLTSIEQALDFVDEKIIGEKPWSEAMANSAQRLPFLRLKSRHCANRYSTRCRSAFRFCQTRVLAHFCRLTFLLLFEALLLLAFGFYTPLHSSISIWALILPLLMFNYLLVLGVIIYYRFKDHRKRRKVHRALQLPMPPLPRVNTASDYCLSADQRREKAFRGDRRGHSSSQSSGSITNNTTNTNNNNGYEPMIELLISGSTTGATAAKRIRTYSHQPPPPLSREQQRTRTPDEEKMEKLRLNGCLTSPIGYDVFLSCSSSSELDWITQKAVPELHKNGLSYTSALMCHNEMKIPFLHTASHILYYIPSYKTFLSGMIEIAYFIGHADWQVTVCVPRKAECLMLLDDAAKLDAEIYRAVERRNECYRMAFTYLKDMAARRQVRVFTRVEDAIKHIRDATNQQQKQERNNSSAAAQSGMMGGRTAAGGAGGGQTETTTTTTTQFGTPPKRTALRQILEKQHLVKERTSQNLLAHLKEAAARGQQLELDLAEIRPEMSRTDSGNTLDPNLLHIQ